MKFLCKSSTDKWNWQWSYTISNITSSPGIITFLVPCYTAGKNAEAMDESCLLHGLAALVPLVDVYCHALIRGKIREKYNIEVNYFCLYRNRLFTILEEVN